MEAGTEVNAKMPCSASPGSPALDRPQRLQNSLNTVHCPGERGPAAEPAGAFTTLRRLTGSPWLKNAKTTRELL